MEKDIRSESDDEISDSPEEESTSLPAAQLKMKPVNGIKAGSHQEVNHRH